MLFEVLLLGGLTVWAAGWIREDRVRWIAVYWFVLLILRLMHVL